MCSRSICDNDKHDAWEMSYKDCFDMSRLINVKIIMSRIQYYTLRIMRYMQFVGFYALIIFHLLPCIKDIVSSPMRILQYIEFIYIYSNQRIPKEDCGISPPRTPNLATTFFILSPLSSQIILLDTILGSPFFVCFNFAGLVG